MVSHSVRFGAAQLVAAVLMTAVPGTPSQPKIYEPSYSYDLFDQSLVRPTTRVLDPALYLRRITGHLREAANVDENDRLRLPSTWWQPRLGFVPVAPERVGIGPVLDGGPAAGTWEVTSAKTQGVTPGFHIRDARGDTYLVKFDPAGWPDLNTAADVIGSRLFWAAGYNVPENSIVHFRLEDLRPGKNATWSGAHGKKRSMTAADLEKMLARVPRDSSGTYRGMASRFLPGKPLGPFRYEGRRSDDSEDLIPHELRRELRGLWALCAWVNHADSRSANSLDMWVTDQGRTFVRHYLVDFGATLGAGPGIPRAPQTGSEYYVDFGVMARSAVTLGTRPFGWESSNDPRLPSVGRFEAATFDPDGWRPDYPNPAFDARTARDIRWGVRLVAAFSDADIRAAVAAGDYDDPRAAAYVTQVLIDRRDKLVRRWLGAQPAETEETPGTTPHKR